ncbi:MAG TPA: TolC family protein [Vicinamibacterales bacterium]|nr:TolC family protein [Vicinamibacterales bacterium]
MAIGTVIVSVGVHAQVPARIQPEPAAAYIDAVNGVTLEDAIARALAGEPALRASRAQLDVARALQTQAGLRPNPSVSFSQLEEPASTDNQTRVEVQWPLDLFRKTGRVGVADREVVATQLAAADRERLLAASVRMKYGEVVTAARSLSITEELLAATTRQRTLVAARVEQGAAPPLDRDMLRVEVQRLEAERLVQAGTVERRLVELKRLLGMPPDAALSLRDSLEQLVRREPTTALTAADAERTASRPDVRQAETQVAVAEAQIDRAEREGQFDISLFGMYMRSDAGFPQRGFGPTGDLERVRGVFHYWSAGAMVTLPLLNRNQGAVAAAQAQRTTASAQVDAARLTAQAEVTAARVRDLNARRALDAYGNEAVSLARQNLDIVRQTYELGRGTLLDVLNEQRRYLELERSYTEVLREAFESRQILKEALGEIR